MKNIKQLLVLTILATGAISCGESSESTAEEAGVSVETQYDEFKNSEEAKSILALEETIQKGIDHEKGFILLPQDVTGLAGIELDFDNNTRGGVVYSPAFLGEKPTIWLGRQRQHESFINSLSDGLDTYMDPVKKDHEESLKTWAHYRDELTNYASNAEYYVLVVVKSLIIPDAHSNGTFDTGSLVAKVVILDTESGKKIGSIDFSATNSDELFFYEGDNSVKKIKEDFEKNINTALVESLEKHTKSLNYEKGNPPHIKMDY